MSVKSERAFSQAVEDYVKAVYELQQAQRPVATTELAARVGASPAAATKMLKHLASLGLLEHTLYYGARLTDSGERIALEILRHHGLIELFLHERLGYSWDEVHHEADVLEHYISERMEERLANLLGDPALDPHGEPIPTRDGLVAALRGTSLAEAEPGAALTVLRVADRDPAALQYLQRLGIALGIQINVLEKQPFNGPLTLAINSETCVIGRELADYIFVEERD